MSRKLRILAYLFAALVLLIGGGVIGYFWAVGHVPTFYAEALQADPVRMKTANDEMLATTAALVSNVQKKDTWSALFTADQINGWLSVDLPHNYPKLLPREFVDPRVRITPERVSLACKYQTKQVSLVASLDVELYVTETGEIALRIERARAGALPVPLSSILDGLTAAVANTDWRLRWQQEDGDPVALLTIPPQPGRKNVVYKLETISLREGAIYLSGRTEPADAKPAKPPRVADHLPENTSSQR